MSVPASWVMGLLMTLQPEAPWSDTYEKTAEAIARVSETDPLFAVEEQGEERTAALLVALAWHESRFRPSAKSKDGKFYCLYQVGKQYFPDARQALSDQEMCTRTAVKLLRQSLETCRTRPLPDRLAVYVSGRCDRGTPQSRYRMHLATKLLKEHPMPSPPPAEPARTTIAQAR